MNRIGILLLFVIYLFWNKEGAFCKNMLGLIKAKNGEKNCPARKNREREDSDDFIKKIAALQTPRRSSKKRQNQPILNSILVSRGKDFIYHEHYRAHPSESDLCV
jgi:hypothetical protein